jgi:hypothetical protein
MGFQFKNLKTGHVYTLNEIDAIAAKFWGKEVLADEYAYPGEAMDRWMHMPNWFDMLGHPIEDLQFFTYKDDEGRLIYKRAIKPRSTEFEMNEVASLMLNDHTRCSENTKRMYSMLEFLKPYVELCFHLKELDIVGVGCGW